MNDLEHDLHELFNRQASDLDAPMIAPTEVLQRGRRRQIRTVAASAIASVLAVAVAIVAIGSVRQPKIEPAGPLPVRTTTIGGVPVGAPAGWTLIDDWPLSGLLSAGSKSCSASATAIPAGENAPSNGEQSTESNASCTTTYPAAGAPVLQLANFEIPLTESVCGLGNEAPTPLPSDGVAVYVTDMLADPNIPALQRACPGSEDAAAGSLQTFMDVNHHTIYAAIGLVGPDAPDEDVQAAHDYIQTLSGIEVTPTAPASGMGPAYVIAAGSDGNSAWRLEAGITSFGQQDATAGAVLVTTDGEGEHTNVVEAGDATEHQAQASLGIRGGTIWFGIAPAGASVISIVAENGSTTPTTTLPWPVGVRTLQGAHGTDGSIWFALTSARGVVQTITPPPSELATPPEGSALPFAQQDGSVTASGHDLGVDWELRSGDGPIRSISLTVNGESVQPSPAALEAGNTMAFDTPNGTFLVAAYSEAVTDVSVTDVSTQERTGGLWMPTKDAHGNDVRVWLLPLAGSGLGTLDDGAALPGFVSWPSDRWRDGSVLASGSDQVVSWALTYRDDHCIELRTIGVDPADSGTSKCIPPPSDLTQGTAVTKEVFGASRLTVAVEVPNRPETTVTSPDVPADAFRCAAIDTESNFAGTKICVLGIDDGQQVTIDVDQGGDPLNGPFKIHWENGSFSEIVPGATGSP